MVYIYNIYIYIYIPVSGISMCTAADDDLYYILSTRNLRNGCHKTIHTGYINGMYQIGTT